MPTEPKLCYVCEPWAYFCNCEPTEAWGDDWNDAYYSCNAEEPYPQYFAFKVAFDSRLVTPAEYDRELATLSVEQINEKAAPWLQPRSYDQQEPHIGIFAGVTLPEFRQLIAAAGGEVYERVEPKPILSHGAFVTSPLAPGRVGRIYSIAYQFATPQSPEGAIRYDVAWADGWGARYSPDQLNPATEDEYLQAVRSTCAQDTRAAIEFSLARPIKRYVRAVHTRAASDQIARTGAAPEDAPDDAK